MFSLLYCFLIYGYICVVIASEVPAYQLQKDQWLFVNTGDESSVTTGSAKKICCRVGYIFASFEVVYLCVSMLLSLHHCFQCSVCDVEQVCKYSIFLTLFAVFVHCFHGGYYELNCRQVWRSLFCWVTMICSQQGCSKYFSETVDSSFKRLK